MTENLVDHKALQFIQNLYQIVDNRDSAALGDYLADDLVFKLGNLEAIHGKEAVLVANEGFFQSIAKMIHTIEVVWSRGCNIICAGSVEYTRHDNTNLTIPFSTILTLNDDLITNYQIYADVSPL